MNERKFARVNARVEESTKEFLMNYKYDNRLLTQGEAIDELVKQFQTEKTNQLVADQIAQATANYVIDGLKRQYLDPLRIRTGYADKQTKVLIQMMNHLMVKGDFDDPNIITTDVHPSTALKVSEEKIQKEIEHFKQRKNTREATREGRQEPTD